jgi:hypothetical protein
MLEACMLRQETPFVPVITCYRFFNSTTGQGEMADERRGVHSLPARSLEPWLDSLRVSVITLVQPIRETLWNPLGDVLLRKCALVVVTDQPLRQTFCTLKS